MAGELGDLTEFMKDSSVADLDWLDVDEKDYRELDQLPKQNLDIVPELEAAWSHTDEPPSRFVPNTGAPKTMLDVAQAGPIPLGSIVRLARLTLMQTTNKGRIYRALRARFDPATIREAASTLREVLAERGLLGGHYIDAEDFPKCNTGSKQASDFVRRFAHEAKFVKAKSACESCVHRTAWAAGQGHCAVFHKQIELEVPYTEELAEAVEQSQAGKGKVAASVKIPAPSKRTVADLKKWMGDNGSATHYLAGRWVRDMDASDTDVRRAVSELMQFADEAAKEGEKRDAKVLMALAKTLKSKTLKSARERIQAALLSDTPDSSLGYTGRHQEAPKPEVIDTQAKLAEAQEEAKAAEETAKQAAAVLRARPIVALLRREMLKGRSEPELIHGLRLAFDLRELQALRPQWEPLFHEAGLYGAVYSTQDSFDDCRIGADFLNKHSSKVRAIVAGDKCGSCIFSKVGRCMMYGRKLVKDIGEILTAGTVAAVLDEQHMVGNLPQTAKRQKWSGNPREQLRAIYRAASGPKTAAVASGLRGRIEQAFYGAGASEHQTSDLTVRNICKAASQYMNEGLYGHELLTVLKGRFELRNLTAAKEQLRAVLSEQGLQGIKYVDPTAYDDYGKGCQKAASLHRSRKAVKFAKVGSACGSCVHQSMPGTCSVLDKQLVIEPPYIDKAAEQRAMLESGPSTEVNYASLMNNGLSMMQEYEIQQGEGEIILNAAVEDDPEVFIEFGNQEVRL